MLYVIEYWVNFIKFVLEHFFSHRNFKVITNRLVSCTINWVVCDCQMTLFKVYAKCLQVSVYPKFISVRVTECDVSVYNSAIKIC